jgi:HlyD family secretion protein
MRPALDHAEIQKFSWCPVPLPPAPFARLRGVAWTGNVLFFGFILGLGTWSAFAPLESAVIAPGIVEAESSRKTIQHLEGGIIKEILIADGDVVRSGQILIKLDGTKNRAEFQSLQGQFWDTMAREARLQAEQQGYEQISFPSELETAQERDPSVAPILAGQQSIIEARRQVFQSQAAVIREKMLQVEKEIEGLKAQESATGKRAGIVREEVATVTILVDKGYERRPRLLSLEREMADIDGRRGDITAQISRAAQVISESQETLLKLENDRQNEIAQSLRDTQSQIFQLRERIQAAKDQLSRTEVRAPEDGVVTDLRIHTPGGVIGPGAPLMDLVPRHDRLIVTARVRPEDIDVVHPGLTADVHLTAYNERRVPRLKGAITHVSADRLLDKRTDQPYYTAKIRLQEKQVAELDGVQIIPGMTTQVFIKTGRSTVALYALRPLLDSFGSAFRER